MQRDRVLFTGFGPFGKHFVNASWEAVKLVPNFTDEEIEVIAELVPVTYTDVDVKVKSLREKYKPTLVIHVGVSDMANKITLETRACREGYLRIDCMGNTHPTGKCCDIVEGCDVISCKIDVKAISDEVNAISKNMTCISENAGRYLCEYIFYKSMLIDDTRTMFIHVPPLNEPFTEEELAECLFVIAKAALKQIACKNNR